MTDPIHLSPNSPILLTASLHVAEARKAITSLVTELLQESRNMNNASDVESVSLDQAINRILAEDLHSPIDVPAADNSAMDGFAFNGDCLDDSGNIATLKVLGTAYAGKPFIGNIGVSECVKIMTGALMPHGCDTVIPQEFTESVNGCSVGFKQNQVKRGENRRLRGEDLQSGKSAITVINAARVQGLTKGA